MTEPWLSVVMPTYNSERYLRETLESLVTQDERGFECVVIDGGSTDGTRQIIADFSRELAIRLFVRPEFPNWVGKTNFGFLEARAQHVCMLHHDDRWNPGRASAIRAALVRHPDVALVLHSSNLIDEDGRHIGNWTCPLRPEPKVYAPSELLEYLMIQNFIAVPSPTFRRDAALSVGGIDALLWYTGDWDFYLKLARTGPSIYLDLPLAAFRIHVASLTMKGSSNIHAFQEQLSIVLERHIGTVTDVRRAVVKRAALASNDVNTALAAALRGSYGLLPHALGSVASLGPSGWRRYFRSSRIHERVMSRLRARGMLLVGREVAS